MTYEDLTVGKFNEVAVKASRIVLENLGKEYPVLIIQGRLGSGKTHLLNAMESVIPKENVIKSVNSNQLMNEMVTSMRENTHMRFRQEYQDADVLLIDDLHDIANRTGTQNEAIHVIKNRVANKKQTVLATARNVYEIGEMNENLEVFLKSALVVEIHDPSLEERSLVVKNIAMRRGILIPDEISYHIAETYIRNMRELEGAILKIEAVSKILNISLDIKMAKEVLKPFQIVDDKYDEAVSIAIERGTISSTYLKEHLKITYKRAKKIIQQMDLQNVSCPITGRQGPSFVTSLMQ